MSFQFLVGLELMATFHNHLQEKHSPAQLLELLEGMEQVRHTLSLSHCYAYVHVHVSLSLSPFF